MRTPAAILFLLGCVQVAAAGDETHDGSAAKHEIKTQPPGAEVYLDWQLLGQTPLILEEDPPAGSFLVVVRDGFHARSRTIERPRSFYFRLSAEQETHHRRILLRILGPESTSFQELLVEQLAQKDFFVHPEPDVAALERHLREIEDRSKKPLLAWARADFSSHSWIVVRLPGVAPDLDLSDLLLDRRRPAGGDLDAGEGATAGAAVGEDTAVDQNTATVRVLDLRQGTLDEEFEIESKNFYSTHSWKRKHAEEQLAEAIADTLLDWAESKMELTQPWTVTAVDLGDDG